MTTVELPIEIEQLRQDDWQDLGRRALEGLMIEAFRLGKLSSHQVGNALGMANRSEAVTFLAERGVYPGYDVEDFEQDMRMLVRIDLH